MGTQLLTKSKGIILRESSLFLLKRALIVTGVQKVEEEEEELRRRDKTRPMWISDARTGIYYPKGQERVMDGVPINAATFDQTCWFRSLEGVDSDDSSPTTYK